MVKIIHTITAKLFVLLIVSWTALSCAKETPVNPAGNSDEGQLTLQTRAPMYAGDPDAKIVSLRVIAVTSGGKYACNKYFTSSQMNLDSDNQITLTLRPATYTFYIIANENAALKTQLDQISAATNYGGSLNYKIDASAFNLADPIPMIKRTDNVTVLPNSQGIKLQSDDTVYSPWKVTLDRLAVRFDFLLTSTTWTASSIKGITLSHFPDRVPLENTAFVPDGSTTQYISRDYDISDSSLPAGTFQNVTANPTYNPGNKYTMAILVSRLIMPSSLFAPASKEDYAPVLGVRLTTNRVLSAYLGEAPLAATPDYTLLRNTQYNISAGVNLSLEVNVAPAAWDPTIIRGDILYRMLNVSQLSATVSESSRARIFFWSDQYVTVEPTGYVGATGTTSFNVSDVFVNLPLRPDPYQPVNFVYNYNTGTKQGVGYVDIYCKPSYASDNIYRIYLNANGLRRELIINVAHHVYWNWPIWSGGQGYAQGFGGAFFRWNQTGERIIYGTNSGVWTATVSYPAERTDMTEFVKLSNLRSLDPNLCSDTPGNPEDYSVNETLTTITGKDDIYFRIGATGKLASSDSQPRYAMVTVTTTMGTYMTMVRQGEEADYVMRRSDPRDGGPNRPYAQRVSPYNLTDPIKVTGQVVDRGPRGYVFTDYPSKAGYMFAWSKTAAVPPTGTFSASLVSSIPGFWDTYKSVWESCPVGYRRINDGPTYQSAGVSDPAYSEFMQSLLLKNYTVQSLQGQNFWQAYYADGYFDRRAITAAPDDWHCQSSTVIGSSDADIAYAGNIYYNPKTFASVFLPAAGAKTGNVVYDSGQYGYYQTASATTYDSGGTVYQGVFYGFNGDQTLPSVSTGLANIRCVKEVM